MKRGIYPLLLVMTMLATLLPNPLMPIRDASASESACTGTVGGVWNDPWCEIGTPEQLDKIRDYPSGRFRLTGHIDLSGYANWVPINAPGGRPFTGQLDGNGYTISNLTITGTANNIGLFGYLSDDAPGAVIANVHLTNVNISGIESVGGIAGHATSFTQISGSSVSGVVEGEGHVGLLVGYNQGTISDSYTQGEVRIPSSVPTWYDSYGGLVGYNVAPTITRSYTTAFINGTGRYSGAFIGWHIAGSVTDSFWSSEASGIANPFGASTGQASITEATVAEMQSKSTYSTWAIGSDGVWNLIEGVTYPLHQERYRSVALSDLQATVSSGGGAPLQWVTPFQSDNGVYTIKASAQTESIELAASPMKVSSSVAGDGNVTLVSGSNNVDITVTAVDGLSATYRLNVIRDEGSALHPHRITSAEELAAIGVIPAYGLDHHYVLEADIDLSGYSTGQGWQPIGSAADPFTGSFEGKRHTVANMTINRPGSSHVGLFGALDNAIISDLYIVRADVAGDDRVGGLTGEAAGTTISGVAVQGSVQGDDAAGATGGIIGYVDDDGGPATSVTESYAAVSGAAGGLIGDGAEVGTVTGSFWDSDVSGSVVSSGGGTAASTADMMISQTFAAAGWVFDDNHWTIIEGGTYPMPAAAREGVRLNGITVVSGGDTVQLDPPFAGATAGYTADLDSPSSQVSVSVAANDPSAAVSINGVLSDSRTIDLDWGANPIEITTLAPNGWQSVYRLTLTSPQPAPVGMTGPNAGWYGIGDELVFTVDYNFAVDVTGAQPELPIAWSGSDSAAAARYIGPVGADPVTMRFVYTVEDGVMHASGTISLEDDIALPPTASIQANNQPVSLSLLGLIPDMSGVFIDGLVPTLALSSVPAVPTGGSVTVEVDADGTGSMIELLQWAPGEYAAADEFVANAAGITDITGDSFLITENGDYTVYAKDAAGNEAVRSITVANIWNTAPVITLTPDPPSAPSPSVDLTVAVAVFDEDGGNELAGLRWAAGNAGLEDFAAPTFGAAVPANGIIRVTDNGIYTVYAADRVGNENVATISISNIAIPSGPSNPQLPYYPYFPAANAKSFFIVPGQSHTLTYDDVEWLISVGAIEKAMTVKIEDVTATSKALLQTDQQLLSSVYQLSKDAAEEFLTPVQLSLTLHTFEWEDSQKPAIVWYNEESKAWVSIGGVLEGEVITGDLNRLGKFAVIAVTAEEAENQNPDVGTDPGLTDIAGHWAEQSLRQAVMAGVINGYPDGTFRPDQAVTRAEYLLIMQGALGWNGEGEPHFVDQADIPSWAIDAVRAAVRNGVTNGYADGTFRPNALITREEAAVMAARASGVDARDVQSTTFRDDGAISVWARPYIQAAIDMQLVQGQGDNRFHPKGQITRAEAAVLLLRIKQALS